VRRSELQRVAVCGVAVGGSGSELQYVILPLCLSLMCSRWHTTAYAATLHRCVAVRCSELQRDTVCCSVLQCIAVRCSVLQCVAAYCCSVLQCVAVCCSETQWVAACCSVCCCSELQRVAVCVVAVSCCGSEFCRVRCCRWSVLNVQQIAHHSVCSHTALSFAKEPYKRDYILQKRPIILRSLLIVATA